MSIKEGGNTFEVGEDFTLKLDIDGATEPYNVTLRGTGAEFVAFRFEDGVITVTDRILANDVIGEPVLVGSNIELNYLPKVTTGGEFASIEAQVTDAQSNQAQDSVDVKVVVATGIVPNVIDLPQQEGGDDVEGAGFVVGTITTRCSDTIAAGRIIDYNPKGVQPLGTAINLVVSTGPCGPEMTTVPNVVGDLLVNADAEITGANLEVGNVTEVFSTAPVGQVTIQSPVGGTQVPVGSAVNLTVSKGEEPVPGPLALVVTSADEDFPNSYQTNGTMTFRAKINGDVPAPYTVRFRGLQSDQITVTLNVDGSVTFVSRSGGATITYDRHPSDPRSVMFSQMILFSTQGQPAGLYFQAEAGGQTADVGNISVVVTD